MRGIFYSLAVLFVLLVFFSLSSQIQTMEKRMGHEQTTLVENEKIDFLFENVGIDLKELLGLICTGGNGTVHVTIRMPGEATSTTANKVSAYSNFIKKNFPVANFDVSGILSDLGGNVLHLNISGTILEVNYNPPKITFPLESGKNITFSFNGTITNMTWTNPPSGTIPLCISGPGYPINCWGAGGGGGAGANIYVNNSNNAAAGYIDLLVLGNNDIQIHYNHVDFNLIPSLDTNLGWNATAEIDVLGGRLTYALATSNRTDIVGVC